MTRSIEIAIVAWLVVAAAAYVLAIYEILGLLPDTPIHTISFFSSRNLWLAVTIMVAVPLGAIIFDVWFFWHIHQHILKLPQ